MPENEPKFDLWDVILYEQRKKTRESREDAASGVVFEVDFARRETTDAISGVAATFERTTTGGFTRNGSEIIAPIDTPRFPAAGLLIEAAIDPDPITGVARATEAPDVGGNGMQWVIADLDPTVAEILAETTEGEITLGGVVKTPAEVTTGSNLSVPLGSWSDFIIKTTC